MKINLELLLFPQMYFCAQFCHKAGITKMLSFYVLRRNKNTSLRSWLFDKLTDGLNFSYIGFLADWLTKVKLSIYSHSEPRTRSLMLRLNCFVLEHNVFKTKQLRRLVQDFECLEILGLSLY